MTRIAEEMDWTVSDAGKMPTLRIEATSLACGEIRKCFPRLDLQRIPRGLASVSGFQRVLYVWRDCERAASWLFQVGKKTGEEHESALMITNDVKISANWHRSLFQEFGAGEMSGEATGSRQDASSTRGSG